MRRTALVIVMAFAIFFLHGVSSARALHHTTASGIRAAHGKTTVVPADDDGDDDGDDSGSGSGDSGE